MGAPLSRMVATISRVGGCGMVVIVHSPRCPVSLEVNTGLRTADPRYAGTHGPSSGPGAIRSGPCAEVGSTCLPRCRTSTTPSRCRYEATLCVRSMSSRQSVPPTTFAASLGQIVAPSRCRSSALIVATMRCERPWSVCSHQASPRSPSATFASCTRGRACSGSERTSRRAAINSATSSARNFSGMDGSEARHLRPLTMMWWPSGVRSGSDVDGVWPGVGSMFGGGVDSWVMVHFITRGRGKAVPARLCSRRSLTPPTPNVCKFGRSREMGAKPT